MEPAAIARALLGDSREAADAAVACLLSYDEPMAAVDVRAAVEEAEGAGKPYPLFHRPSTELTVGFVLQVVLQSASHPYLRWSLVRRLLLKVLGKAGVYVQPDQWFTVLDHLLPKLRDPSNVRLLRFAEETLKLSAASFVPALDSHQPEHLSKWCLLLNKWLTLSAVQFGRSTAKPRIPAGATFDAKKVRCFLNSPAVRRIVTSLSDPKYHNFLRTVVKLTSSEVMPFPIMMFLEATNVASERDRVSPSKSSIFGVLEQPGLATALLENAPAGSIEVQDLDEILDHLFQRLSQVACTPQWVMDATAILAAFPAGAIANYFKADAGSRLRLVFGPITGNPKLFCLEQFASWKVATPTVPAPTVIFGKSFINALQVSVFDKPTADTAAALFAEFLNSKCQAGTEKSALLALYSLFLSLIPAELLPTAAQLQQILRTHVGSGSLDIAQGAWNVASIANATKELAPQFQTALTSAASNDEIRRGLLSALQPNFQNPTTLFKKLVDEARSTEVYQGDALLCLKFLTGAVRVKALQEVATLPAIAQLAQDRNAANQIATVACALMDEGHGSLAAMLLTHPGGEARARVLSHLRSASLAVTSNFFDALWKGVFQMEVEGGAKGGAATAPILNTPACLDSLQPALQICAKKLLDGAADGGDDVVQTVSRLVQALGHDFCCGGEDSVFFSLNASILGKYRQDSRASVAVRRAFKAMFPRCSRSEHLLAAHIEKVSEVLAAELTTSPFRARAAARGLAAVISDGTEECAATVTANLLKATIKACESIKGLSKVDMAIAIGTAEAINGYIIESLTAQGLVKDHGVRPPKGMTQDDWEDMKRKDLKQLEAAKAKVAQDVEKRRASFASVLATTLAPFAVYRLVGYRGSAQGTLNLATALKYLYGLLHDQQLPPVLLTAVQETIAATLFRTPLGPFAIQFTIILRRTASAGYSFSALDAGELASVAMKLRMSLQKALHPSLVTALLPFTRCFFQPRSSKQSKLLPSHANIQMLTIFVNSAVQQQSPVKRETIELFLLILRAQPTLYKAVLSGLQGVVEYTSEEDIQPVLEAAVSGAELTRETCVNALSRFQHFDNLPVASLSIVIATYDSRPAVSNSAKSLLDRLEFSYDPALHWPLLIDILRKNGKNAESIGHIAAAIGGMLVAHPTSQDRWLPEVFKVGGLAAVTVIRQVSEHLTQVMQVNAALFLADVIDSPKSDYELMEAALAAGKKLINQATAEAIESLMTTLAPRLRKPLNTTDEANPEHKDQRNAASIVWISALALRTKDPNQLVACLDQQTSMLNVSDSALVHVCVSECTSDIAASPLMRGHQKLDEFVQTSKKQVFQASQYARKKAHSYAIAGTIHGLGMSGLRRFNIINEITDALSDKVQPRAGAMVLIEVLADSLGYNFEPYSLGLVPHVLTAVSDKDPRVSETAEDAAKAIMRNLSDIGLRQLVPKLIEGLEADQTKKKISALGFIGYIAFCSPKQLAAALPKVIPYIADCLFDVNTGVANAAFGSLKRVAGVVSNPEIQEHVESLLRAMRSPGTETENALDGLMYTRFTNVVDPASLALIIPIVTRGLTERLHTTKGKAAQVVASLLHLIKDGHTIRPYASDLLQRLQNCSLDPMNEVRTTSAKAISTLVSQLRGNLIDEAVAWALATLRRAITSAEKSGAAQVLTETIASVGEGLLAGVRDELLQGCVDPIPNVREGFMYVFVFAPSALPVSMFQQFLPAFFPAVLKALSDPAENVRDVALQAGTSIIQLHGTRALDLLLGPLMEGVIAENTSTRQSSMLLVAKLLIHFAQQIRKKFKVLQNQQQQSKGADGEKEGGEDEDFEEDGEETRDVVLDSARDAEKAAGFSLIVALEEQLGSEAFCRLLAAMHVGRSEHNQVVRAEVALAWQICVASPRTAINKIFNSVVTMLLKFAASDNPECQDVTQRCIEYTCSRLNEAIDRFVLAYSQEYQKGERKRQLGALFCVANVVPYADAPRITKLGAAIAACVMPALQEEDPDVRASGGLVFEAVGKVVGPRWIESIVETQMQSSVLGVIELVRVRPVATLQVVFDFLAKKKLYSEDDMELMQFLFRVDQAEPTLPKYFDAISRVLMTGEIQGLKSSQQGLELFAEYLQPQYAGAPVDDYAKQLKQPASRAAGLRCLIHYGCGLKADAPETVEKALCTILPHIVDEAEETRMTAAHGFMKLAASLDQKAFHAMPEGERSDDGNVKRNASKFGAQFADAIQQTLAATGRSNITTDQPFLPILALPKLVDCISLFYTRALEHGSSTQKIVALDGMMELLQFSPPDVAAAAGASFAPKLVKVFFSRNEGTVVNALLQLFFKIMSFPSTGKERMMEGSLCSSLFNATLCDSAEARARTHRMAVVLLQRHAPHVEQLLAGINSRRTSAETSAQKTSMCRYISVIARYGKTEKRIMAAAPLFTVVRGFWEGESAAELTAAAGMAVGAICSNIAIADDVFASIADRAVQQIKSRSMGVLAGLSCITALVTSARHRLDSDLITASAQALLNVFNFTTDRTTILWALRCSGGLLENTTEAARFLTVDALTPLLKRVGRSDDQMQSTAYYLVQVLKKKFPQTPADHYNDYWAVPSAMTTDNGDRFDPDIDDEYFSGTPIVV